MQQKKVEPLADDMQAGIEELILNDTIIKAAITQAETASKDLSQPYYPAIVKRLIVTTDEIEDYLSHAQLSEDSLRELNLISPKRDEQENSCMQKGITMSEDILSPLISSLNLSAYDRAVLEAIYSQILASPYESNCLFSIRGLFRTMCGSKKRDLSCSAEQKSILCNTISKLMSTVVSIEQTGFSRKGVPISRKTTFNLVSAKIEEINIGGVETTSVRILSYPEFLAFARKKGGITATPIDMLNIPKISMTVRNTAIINYLQHQISNVTFSRQASSNREKLAVHNELHLDYAPIYEIAEIKPLIAVDATAKATHSKTYRNRVRTTVHKIMDCWIEKGYIKGWRDLTSSKGHIYGIAINLCDNVLDSKLLPELRVL